MARVRLCPSKNKEDWDKYVERHPGGSFYHLYNWRHIIKQSYGHEPYYLIAERNPSDKKKLGVPESIVGVLPLFFIKPPISGGSLISLPFVDFAGVIADTDEAERELVKTGLQIGISGKGKYIELRKSTNPEKNSDQKNSIDAPLKSNTETVNINQYTVENKCHKVRMLLELPDTSDSLMSSFKSKLRSQIKRPIKEGLKTRIGGLELLNDFYAVFSQNMRDLGSPVHSKEFIRNVLKYFQGKAKIVMVYKDAKPLAGSIILKHGKIMANPWASALQGYKHLSPNMLLYWAMLEHGCNTGCEVFDFGRSSPESGTYKFKQQWGARPHPLCWQYIYINGASGKSDDITKSSLAETAVNAWKKLPVMLTTLIGPPIRKYITL